MSKQPRKNREAPPAIDEETRERLAAEAAGLVSVALRCLRRVHQGDEEAVGRALAQTESAAADKAGEPIVIRCESMGSTELVTLREYIEEYVQDWEIGFQQAEEILAEDPHPFVHNQYDAIRHPELLQLHRAISARLLADEIDRLKRER